MAWSENSNYGKYMKYKGLPRAAGNPSALALIFAAASGSVSIFPLMAIWYIFTDFERFASSSKADTILGVIVVVPTFAFFAGFAVFLIVKYRSERQEYLDLTRNAEVGEGQIVAKWTFRIRWVIVHQIAFRFKGNLFKQTIPIKVFYQNIEGRKVKVEYRRGTPRLCRAVFEGE